MIKRYLYLYPAIKLADYADKTGIRLARYVVSKWRLA
jgi:hypothetical protein